MHLSICSYFFFVVIVLQFKDILWLQDMVQVKEEAPTLDIGGFISCSSLSDSSYEASTPRCSSEPGYAETFDFFLSLNSWASNKVFQTDTLIDAILVFTSIV